LPNPELTVEPAPYQPVHVFLNVEEYPGAWKRERTRHASFPAWTNMR
jgi:hypothetical protein